MSQEIDKKITPLWYAAYTRSRFEKKVAAELTKRKVEHFLPLVPQVRFWSDRKKVVQMPLFPGYVFVHIPLKERLRVLEVDGVVRLVGFGGTPSHIPETQIEDVRRLLSGPKRPESCPYLETGDWVKITSGPFEGVTGRLIQQRGENRLLVAIELIKQAISIEVELSWLQRVKDRNQGRRD